MKTDKIKLAVLGAGTILDAYAPAFAANDDRCEVVAVAVSDKTRKAAHIREKLGDKVEIYEGWQTLVDNADFDAAIINLPHDLHAEATEAVAGAKKHVLCEKVMARNVAECRRMIDACKQNGVSLVIGHNRRYEADWVSLKELIDSGKLGKILFYKLEHNQNVIFPKDNWVFESERLGGGAIMSCLTHEIDALRWFGGETDTVTCMSTVLPERMQGECIGAVTAMMKSGALALLSINWTTTSHRTKNGLWYELIHVCGTEGEAYYLTGRGTNYKIHGASDKAIFEYALPETDVAFERILPGTGLPSHTVMVMEWLKFLRGEPNKVCTFGEDSIHTVEVAQAAYISRDTGTFAKLPLSL